MGEREFSKDLIGSTPSMYLYQSQLFVVGLYFKAIQSKVTIYARAWNSTFIQNQLVFGTLNIALLVTNSKHALADERLCSLFLYATLKRSLIIRIVFVMYYNAVLALSEP